MNKLIGSQYLFAQFLWIHFFLSCWTNDVTNFPNVMKLMSSPNCHLRFSIFVPETLKFKWQCSQYLELNPTCDYGRIHDSSGWGIFNASAQNRENVGPLNRPMTTYSSYHRYAWRESPCPNGIENCAIYSRNSTTDTLALPAPPFIFDNSAWNYVK